MVFKKGQSIESLRCSMPADARVNRPPPCRPFRKGSPKFPSPKQCMRRIVTFVTFLKTSCSIAEKPRFVKCFSHISYVMVDIKPSIWCYDEGKTACVTKNSYRDGYKSYSRRAQKPPSRRGRKGGGSGYFVGRLNRSQGCQAQPSRSPPPELARVMPEIKWENWPLTIRVMAIDSRPPSSRIQPVASSLCRRYLTEMK